MDDNTQPVEATNTGADTDTQDAADQDNLTPVEQLMRRMSAHVLNGDAASAQEATAEPNEPDSKTEPAAAEEAPSEPEPEPAKTKPDERLELKYGQAIEQVKRTTSELVSVKQEVGTLKAEKEAIARRAKENPLKLVEELSGMDFATLMQKAAAGEFDGPKHAGLPPEVQAQLDELTEFRKQEVARKESEKQAEVRKADITTIQAALQEQADEYPFSNAFDFVAEEIVDDYHRELAAKRRPDVAAIAREKEKLAKNMVRNTLLNGKALALLAKDSEVRDSLAKVFGNLSEPKKSPVSDPRTVPAPKQPARTLPTTQEIPTRTEQPDRTWSRDEEREESIRLLRQHLTAGQL